MKVMKVKLDPGAFMPDRAYPTDAGLDLRTPTNAYCRPMDSVTIDTGVHISSCRRDAVVCWWQNRG